MPNKNIVRGPAAGGAPADFFNAPNANGVYIDGATGELILGTGTSGVASKTAIDSGNGVVVQHALFTEAATSLTHTATFVIPAGAELLDIIVVPQVLWTGGTAALSIGDANAATGWFNAFNLKATDLVLGERLQASSSSFWGGKNGSYLDATAGRFGQQSANMIGGFNPTAYSVIAVVTVTTPATTAGRTHVYVLHTTGKSVVPVLA
jgi:hypothetical protein